MVTTVKEIDVCTKSDSDLVNELSIIRNNYKCENDEQKYKYEVACTNLYSKFERTIFNISKNSNIVGYESEDISSELMFHLFDMVIPRQCKRSKMDKNGNKSYNRKELDLTRGEKAITSCINFSLQQKVLRMIRDTKNYSYKPLEIVKFYDNNNKPYCSRDGKVIKLKLYINGGQYKLVDGYINGKEVSCKLNWPLQHSSKFDNVVEGKRQYLNPTLNNISSGEDEGEIQSSVEANCFKQGAYELIDMDTINLKIELENYIKEISDKAKEVLDFARKFGNNKKAWSDYLRQTEGAKIAFEKEVIPLFKKIYGTKYTANARVRI